MSNTVRVKWKSRQRDLPTEIQKTGKVQKTHWGFEVVSFWGPNIYATPPGAHDWYLNEAALDALIEAQQELVDGDASLLIVDAYLTYDEQQDKYERKPNLAVPPDKSMHTRGFAVDVRYDGCDQEEFEDILAAYGWERTVPSEPWHFDYKGEI
jgi:D-alanyl-D-alanine dipeptidase